MKKLAAAMTLIGALTPTLYSAPAKAWGCGGCSYPIRHTSVTYKPVVYRTVSYRPVVSTHVYYQKVLHHYFGYHHACFCCGNMGNTSSFWSDYAQSYNMN